MDKWHNNTTATVSSRNKGEEGHRVSLLSLRRLIRSRRFNRVELNLRLNFHKAGLMRRRLFREEAEFQVHLAYLRANSLILGLEPIRLLSSKQRTTRESTGKSTAQS